MVQVSYVWLHSYFLIFSVLSKSLNVWMGSGGWRVGGHGWGRWSMVVSGSRWSMVGPVGLYKHCLKRLA